MSRRPDVASTRHFASTSRRAVSRGDDGARAPFRSSLPTTVPSTRSRRPRCAPRTHICQGIRAPSLFRALLAHQIAALFLPPGVSGPLATRTSRARGPSLYSSDARASRPCRRRFPGSRLPITRHRFRVHARARALSPPQTKQLYLFCAPGPLPFHLPRATSASPAVTHCGTRLLDLPFEFLRVPSPRR